MRGLSVEAALGVTPGAFKPCRMVFCLARLSFQRNFELDWAALVAALLIRRCQTLNARPPEAVAFCWWIVTPCPWFKSKTPLVMKRLLSWRVLAFINKGEFKHKAYWPR